MITLNDVIKDAYKDEKFHQHFQREMLINEIAKLFVQLRNKSKLTQKELAKKVGTSQPVIARLESGKDRRVPSLELLTKLANAMNAKLRIVVEENKESHL